MLTFIFIHAVVTVLFPITPPGQRDALTAISTPQLVFPALRWWCLTVLDTNERDQVICDASQDERNALSMRLSFHKHRNSIYYCSIHPHLPSHLPRLCSRPHHRTATPSASTRGCAGIAVVSGSVWVLCSTSRQSGHCNQRIHHISEPQTHIDR